MGLVRKCDRCDAIFDAYDRSENMMVTGTLDFCSDTRFSYRNKDISTLCPECIEDLSKWLNKFNNEKGEF